MQDSKFKIRNALPSEFELIGKLMVEVYSQLKGFPNAKLQPAYYQKLAMIGQLATKENTELLVAVSDLDKIGGAVVYFSDMINYGSGGSAPQIKNASGFRLLAVDPTTRGMGLGKLLCRECISRAKASKQKQLIIHSTESMVVARRIYQKMGFKRYPAIDFKQGDLLVFGFKLDL